MAWTEQKIPAPTTEVDYQKTVRSNEELNNDEQKTELPKTVYKKVDPEGFVRQREQIPDRLRPFLTPYNAREYRDMNIRLYLSESAKSGYGISENGDLISVFSLLGVKEGIAAVRDAWKNGATKLDCIDGKLPGFYEVFGFKEYKRVKWDDKYAPPDWDYSKYGRPDIVFMKLSEE